MLSSFCFDKEFLKRDSLKKISTKDSFSSFPPKEEKNLELLTPCQPLNSSLIFLMISSFLSLKSIQYLSLVLDSLVFI
jgi:hypothetical protein